jgi:monofunctional glycosyltransferase
MKRKITIMIASLFGVLLLYETYAVGNAYIKLSQVFLPYSSVTIEDLGLSEQRQDILVKIQDPNFYRHAGIEWPSPLTSTTITQSLVKKLFFKKFTKGYKKIEQTLISRFVVSPNISKNTQLAAFISTAYFGNKNGKPVIGFEQGALAWFSKSLSELSDDEYLALIAMLPAPNILLPDSAASKERLRRIKRVLNGECVYGNVASIHLDQCS